MVSVDDTKLNQLFPSNAEENKLLKFVENFEKPHIESHDAAV